MQPIQRTGQRTLMSIFSLARGRQNPNQGHVFFFNPDPKTKTCFGAAFPAGRLKRPRDFADVHITGPETQGLSPLRGQNKQKSRAGPLEAAGALLLALTLGSVSQSRGRQGFSGRSVDDAPGDQVDSPANCPSVHLRKGACAVLQTGSNRSIRQRLATK